MKSIKELVTEQVKTSGGDGLANPDIVCGCSISDFPACDCPDMDNCLPAKWRTCNGCENNNDCSIQEELGLSAEDPNDGCFWLITKGIG